MARPVTGTVDTNDRQSLRATVSHRRIVLILAGIILGMLLAALDQTIVGTAMPRVIAELEISSHLPAPLRAGGNRC